MLGRTLRAFFLGVCGVTLLAHQCVEAAFSDLLLLSSEVSDVVGLQLKVDGGSNAFVAFSGKEKEEHRAVYFVSVVSGLQTLRRIRIPGCDAFRPSLFLGPLATVQILFEVKCGNEVDLYRADNRGGPLDNPLPAADKEDVAEINPAVWLDPAGQVNAVWEEHAGSESRIVRSLRWGETHTLVEGGEDPLAWISPRYRKLHLLYRVGDSLRYQSEETDPVEVYSPLEPSSEYSLCAVGDPEIPHVAFVTEEGVVCSFLRPAQGFAPPELLVPGARRPLIVVSPEDKLYVFCLEGKQLLYTVKGPQGWSEPKPLLPDSAPISDFQAAFDPSGYLHVLTVRGEKVFYQSNVPAPVPDFEASPKEGEVPLTVKFWDRTSGGPVRTRKWDFGDGSTSTERDPLHVYSKAGLYSVKLTAEGPGGTATVTKKDFIVARAPRNKLMIPEIVVWPGQRNVYQPIYAIHPDPLQGFQLGLAFRGEFVEDVSIDLTGSAVEPLQPELNALSITDGPGGEKHLVLGVVFDVLPPFEGKILPGSSTEQVLAFLTYNVLPTCPIGERIRFDLRNGVGSPPVDNVFTVVGAISEKPSLQGGEAYVVEVPECSFVRGDTNMSGSVDLADAISCLEYLFTGGESLLCQDAADANDSGTLDISDAIYLLGYLFAGERPPPFPFPTPGLDPTEDSLPPCRCP